MLQGINEGLIIEHTLVVTFLFFLDLLHEQILLDERIIKLSEGIAEFHMLDE